MNIQQFQYILTVAELKHFETAADKCCVTQSTLSTMISRFEAEIGVKVFNRKTKPVSITREGEQIIERLQIVYKEIETLNTVIQELKGEMVGEIRIGIIPTVAPYLLPLFLSKFAQQFPKVKMIVQEMTTAEIQRSLKNRMLDVGILALPIQDEDLTEVVLYSEPFQVLDCGSGNQKTTISIEELDYSRVWFLEEGHCLRTQVQQICELSNKETDKDLNFEFKAGSIDSLLRFTKANKGITILPYLATLDLSTEEKGKLTHFASPIPARTIGLLTHRHFVKKRLLNHMREVIEETVHPLIPRAANLAVIMPVKSS